MCGYILKKPSNIPSRHILKMPTTLISINPVGTLRTHSKCAHHFDLVLIGGHIENIFKKNPGVSFTNLLKMRPNYT